MNNEFSPHVKKITDSVEGWRDGGRAGDRIDGIEGGKRETNSEGEQWEKNERVKIVSEEKMEGAMIGRDPARNIFNM